MKLTVFILVIIVTLEVTYGEEEQRNSKLVKRSPQGNNKNPALIYNLLRINELLGQYPTKNPSYYSGPTKPYFNAYTKTKRPRYDYYSGPTRPYFNAYTKTKRPRYTGEYYSRPTMSYFMPSYAYTKTKRPRYLDEYYAEPTKPYFMPGNAYTKTKRPRYTDDFYAVPTKPYFNAYTKTKRPRWNYGFEDDV